MHLPGAERHASYRKTDNLPDLSNMVSHLTTQLMYINPLLSPLDLSSFSTQVTFTFQVTQ